MKYLPINNHLFIDNRARFVSIMKEGPLAVFNSNDIMPTNADGLMPFRQNNDLFYLSGIDQEESIVVIFPATKDEKHKEILFLKETSDEIAIWEGAKLTKEGASKVSGIQTVYWLSEFEDVFKELMEETNTVYLNSNEHLRAKVVVETRDARFTKWFEKTYPMHKIEKSAPLSEQLRAVKSETEVELIRFACNITARGFRRILEFIKPGVMEYEIEAEILHEFLCNRSSGHAYSPIIASGFNACVLHYIDNNQKCEDGDVILMDFGAEYANYASDMTRSLPVNGKFTKRQRAVYEAVLSVMKSATQLLVQGTILKEYHVEVGLLMEKELVDLGLITMEDIKSQDEEMPAYKKYFMHGTSHFLGLDVHDVGDWEKPIEAGNVFTCEPGIYIREENLGIRLENEILVTEKGPIDLMGDIPIESDEIEALMSQVPA